MDMQPHTKDAIFEKLYEERFAWVYNYIYFRVQHAQTAEDLTADVFVRVYQYFDNFTHEKGEIGAWLSGITRNAVNTHLRKALSAPGATELTEFIPAGVDIEREYLHTEDMRQIMEHLQLMPQDKQELIAMKYFLHMNNREIAKATGLSESNVGSTLHRIVEGLRKVCQTL